MKKQKRMTGALFLQGLRENWLVVLAIIIIIAGTIIAVVDKFYLPVTVGALALGQVLKLLHDFLRRPNRE
ncbi:MAG: hypothetical protein Q8L11_00825 [Candidatus Moranbacteria bacterium]|nr:hypothetical protein [bacterium]MDP1833463.1 hypothetical protein [Candidatus Moranbacteria bacterium]